MTLSAEVRRLDRAWSNGSAWPQRLNWVEVRGLRGWTGERAEFRFPIVAVSGENGTGKSTILQAAASAYKDPTRLKDSRYASEFFPSTAWDKVVNAEIRYEYAQGPANTVGSIRKPAERWRGNTPRPARSVEYFDLSRIVPVSGRAGYAKIAKSNHIEASAVNFEGKRLKRLSGILGREFTAARMALSDVDERRSVPVLKSGTSEYSGYHQGQGETTITELIQADLPKYSLVLIDEIESSLHPRAQRRLIRDLASVCRDRELQIILSTHSTYVLEELPEEARMHIFEQNGKRQIMVGASPQFAMSKMDDISYPECELYVEDSAARTFLTEILSQRSKDIASRCLVLPYGAASVGHQLGQMVENRRFPRPTGVFLDGDCKQSPGTHVLPGNDAPELVVFAALKQSNWHQLWITLCRDTTDVTDACDSAMTLSNHHDWIRHAAGKLQVGTEVLWHAMCAEWVKECLHEEDLNAIVRYIEDRLHEYV